MDSEFGVGVLLGRSHTLDELVTAHGGTAPVVVRPRSVDRVVSPRHASRESDLVIVTSARLASVADRAPGTILCSPELRPRLAGDRVWVHPHVWWTVARLLGPDDDAEAPPRERVHSPDRTARDSVHPAAHVDPAAVVAFSARIAAGAVVRAGARVGAGTVIEENAVIYGRSVLGKRVRVGPSAVIGKPGFGFAEGPGGQTVRVPQRGGVIVGDDVEIGALCTVDAGTLSPTRIGRGARLDAHVHVGHNVEIGEGTLVAAQVGFAGSSTVGAGVRIGGQAGIADHVRLGDGVRVAAKSGVIGDVPGGSAVAGFPAVSRVRWLRSMAALLRLANGSRR